MSDSRKIEAKLRQACAQVSSLTARGTLYAALQVLEQSPELAADAEAAIEIIYSEYQSLDELGRRPDADQWLNAYPRYRERLKRLVQLHDLLDESVEVPGSVPSTKHSAHNTTDGVANDQPIADHPINSIGDYELLAEIGRGGMGVVYRARQRGLGRLVAVKVLRATDSTGNERSRFQQEAEAIAALQHPNIVQVYEVGIADDRDFLSMELIEGGSLDVWSQGPTRSYHEIALLIKHLAAAMQYAHELGIVHRDLKPANVLLTNRGEPKVVDFGLAKRLDDSARVRTQTGAVLGTPSYMSPEQATGSGQVGPSSDLFSLGVILYQLLTSRLPFEGSSTAETLKFIAERDPIVPSKHRPSVPRDLETICLKCLAKESAHRYTSARALSEDLARFLDHRTILARRAGWIERSSRIVKRHREASLLAASLGLLLLTVLGYAIWQQRNLHQAQRQADSQTRMASKQRERANQAEKAYETSLQKARELVGRTTDLGMKLANEPGWDETRRKAFEDAASYYEEFLKQHADDPNIRRDAAQAAMRSASLHTDLGRWTEAETRLTSANEWLSELAYDRQAQWLRTDCLLQLAIVNWRLERHGQAEKTFGETIALMRELLSANPDRSDFLLRLANAQTNLCSLIRAQRRFDECLPIYLEAVDNCIHAARSTLELGAGPPADPSQSVEEQLTQRIEESIAIRQQVLGDSKLREKGGNVSDAFAELALTLDDMSAVLVSSSLWKSAEQSLREAVALREAVIQLWPNNRFIEHYAARGMSNLGQMLMDTGRASEAQAFLVKAEQLFAALVKDFPDRVHHKREWAFALVGLARSYSLDHDHTQAVKLAEQAVKVHEQLAASHPGNEWMRRDLVTSLKSLAFCYQAAGDRERAVQQYQRASEVLPDDAMVCNSFAWMLVLNPLVNHAEAQQAVDMSRRATSLVSGSNDYWNTLALACYRLARTSEDAKLQSQTLDEALKAIIRAEELVSGGTISDWYVHAMILASMNRLDEARGWLERAETRRLAQAPNDVELSQFSQEATAATSRSSPTQPDAEHANATPPLAGGR